MSTLDAQPGVEGGVVILVTGQLLVWIFFFLRARPSPGKMGAFDPHITQANDSLLLAGRRRATPNELHPGLPANEGPIGPILCVQRHFQAHLRLRRVAVINPTRGSRWVGMACKRVIRVVEPNGMVEVLVIAI